MRLRHLASILALTALLVGCGATTETDSPATEAASTPAGSPADPSTAAETSTADHQGLMVQDAVANLMPGMGAVYLTVMNHGTEDDRLLRIETPLTEVVETHESIDEDGMMKMVPHPDGFAIPAGATLVLQPGGKHIMLVEPGEVAEGAGVPLTLHFEKAGAMEIEAAVMPMGGGADHDHGHDHGDHDHGAHDHGEGSHEHGEGTHDHGKTHHDDSTGE